MTTYLLDTNHAGVLLDPDATLWTRLESAQDAAISLCQPVIGELWFMVFNSAPVDKNRQRLEELLPQFRIWEFDAAAAREFGRVRAEQRRKGQPIPPIDVQRAAIARHNDLVLLSADKHFAAVSGLSVENWL